MKISTKLFKKHWLKWALGETILVINDLTENSIKHEKGIYTFRDGSKLRIKENILSKE